MRYTFLGLNWRQTWIRCFLLGLTILPANAQREDWLQFPGHNAAGIYSGDVPTRRSDNENLKWVTPLPRKGVSSPIVVGDRLFVTTFSGFGQDLKNPGEIENLRRYLVCVDRKSGGMLWERSPPTRFPEDGFKGFVTDQSYASCTPVADSNPLTSHLRLIDEQTRQFLAVISKRHGRSRIIRQASSPVIHSEFDLLEK